jgi:hypothetical protein
MVIAAPKAIAAAVAVGVAPKGSNQKVKNKIFFFHFIRFFFGNKFLIFNLEFFFDFSKNVKLLKLKKMLPKDCKFRKK